MARKPITGKRTTRPTKGRRGAQNGYLSGQFLIAMPGMRDQRFARSVVYMCAHSNEGAMGIIINQQADNISFPELLLQAKVVSERGAKAVARDVSAMPVHIGGPVEMGRGFVLHSAEYRAESSTLMIDDDICLTTTIDILKAIAAGTGPDQALLALGYAGWDAGQLEREIQDNGWLSCAGDRDIIFKTSLDARYDRALSMLGVNPLHLVNAIGNA